MLINRPAQIQLAGLRYRGFAAVTAAGQYRLPTDLMLTKRSSLAFLGLMVPSLTAAAVSTSTVDEDSLPLSSKTEAQEQQPTDSARRVPHKVVHFVRHGEGFHNVGYDELEDSPLTHRGWADAEALRAHLDTLDSMGNPLQCELVVVSPLTRTLETASAAFGGPFMPSEFPAASSSSFAPVSSTTSNSIPSGSSSPSEAPSRAGSSPNMAKADAPSGDQTCSNGNGAGAGEAAPQVLMKAQTEIRNKRSAHDAILVHPTRPFLAVEEVRERMSVHRCDRRHNLQITKEHFPGVDFHLIKHDEDILWDERHTQSVNEGARGSRYLVAEKTPAVIERGNIFLKWLMKRPEKHIAVVAHREILLNMLRTAAADSPVDVQKALSRGFNHCEMRSVVFAEDGTPLEVLQETYYPGGVARLWLFPVNWAKQKAVKALAGLTGSK